MTKSAESTVSVCLRVCFRRQVKLGWVCTCCGCSPSAWLYLRVELQPHHNESAARGGGGGALNAPCYWKTSGSWISITEKWQVCGWCVVISNQSHITTTLQTFSFVLHCLYQRAERWCSVTPALTSYILFFSMTPAAVGGILGDIPLLVRRIWCDVL